MGEKTQKNLKLAFQGESEAYFRNQAFAKAADKEGYPQVGKLFRAIAEGEAVHCFSILKLRGLVKDTEANLERAFGSETFAVEEAYPNLIKDAEAEGEKSAAVVFSHHRDVEEFHAALYKKAINDMMADRESDYHVCMICGYITDGEVPDNCPVCQAPKGKFQPVV